MRLSKVDIAVIQFESAIYAYQNGAFVEAITLAGAAEEILGKLCKVKNMNTALESYKKIAESYDENLESEKFIIYLNKQRNALKHLDVDKEFYTEVNIEDAKLMLARACINFLNLKLSPTTLIDDFINELRNDVKIFKARK